MNNTSLHEILQSAGLNTDQSLIYEVLLKQGNMKASEIKHHCGLKRGLVYKNLLDLENLQLIIRKEKPGSIATYSASHPSRLSELVFEKKQKIQNQEKVLESVMDNLLSYYRLNAGKPGVRFYEGMEQCIELFKTSFEAKTEILQMYDTGLIFEHNPELLNKLTKIRIQKKVKKKLLSPDSPLARKILSGLPPEITEVKYFPTQTKPQGIMMSFDDKLLIFSLDPKRLVAVEIHEPLASQTFNVMFQALWQLGI